MRVPQWILEKKRDGHELTDAEIRDFIRGYHLGEIPDYQMAALAMAIYLQGMTFAETASLTDAMMRSGELLDTSALTRPVCDKHSTGGIGDKVSLILAPLAAACGLAVPMISGRGLGITGGTLDKLESIPGYRTDLSEPEFLRVVADIGCSIIGQTATLAPVDKKLYALRDVTGTVPSIPLITASIMSKKMAEGLQALVLDVKVGRGAFMKTPAQARELALNMVRVGETMGKSVGALLTNMDVPLGHCIGNALEVRESIDCLQGKVRGPLRDLSIELTAAMLLLCKTDADWPAARARAVAALDSGRGFEHFQRMVCAQGGDPRVCTDPALLPQARILESIPAQSDGWLADVDADAFGRAVLLLGGGRTRAEDKIDPAVGISGLVGPGAEIRRGQPLCQIHANDETRLSEARKLLQNAFRTSEKSAPPPQLVFDRMMPA